MPGYPVSQPKLIDGAHQLTYLISLSCTRRTGTNMPAFSQQAGGALTDRQIALLISGMRASWSKPEAFKGVEIPAYSASETVTDKASDGSIVKASTSGDVPSGARAYQTYCAQCHGSNGAGGAGGSAGS